MAKVAIRNKRTGEVRYVEQSELTGYGFNPDAQMMGTDSARPHSLSPENAVVEDMYAPQEEEVRKGIIDTLIEPFANTTRNILAAPMEGARALSIDKSSKEVGEYTKKSQELNKKLRSEKDPVKKKKLLEESRALDASMDKTKSRLNTATETGSFLTGDQMKKANEDKGGYLMDQAKDSAEIASYGVPFGKGSNFYTKAVLPGMGVGAMQGVSKDDATVDSVVKDTLLGGVTGGVIHGASKALPAIGGVVTRGTGRVLEKTGDNIGLKSLRLRPTQLAKIEERWGEKVPAILERHNVMGRNADEIKELAIEPLQQSFDDIARRSGVQIPKSAIDAKYLEKIDILLKAGDTDSIKLAEKLLQEYDSISKVLGEVNDIATITNKRMLYSNKVKNWTDLLDSGKNEVSADVFREVAQEAAEQAGLRGAEAQTLKELGNELAKLRMIQRNAAVQENLGKGSLPLGLTNLLGIIAGGAGGGVGGATVALGATVLGNSPAAMRIYTRLAQSAGRGLQGAGSTGFTNKLEGGSDIAKNIGVRLPLITGGQEPQTDDNQYSDSESIQHDPMLPSISNDVNTPQSLTGYTPEQLYQAYIQATNEGETKAATQLRKMWEDETEYQESSNPSKKKYSEGDKKFLLAKNEASKAFQLLNDGSVTTGKLPAFASKFSEFFGTQDPNTTKFKSQLATARTAARNALLGANMSVPELESYLDAIFDYSNEPEIIRAKLANFISSMEDYENSVAGQTADGQLPPIGY